MRPPRPPPSNLPQLFPPKPEHHTDQDDDDDTDNEGGDEPIAGFVRTGLMVVDLGFGILVWVGEEGLGGVV